MSDGIMTAWSFTIGFFNKNFGTLLADTPLRRHGIGHNKVCFMDVIKLA